MQRQRNVSGNIRVDFDNLMDAKQVVLAGIVLFALGNGAVLLSGAHLSEPVSSPSEVAEDRDAKHGYSETESWTDITSAFQSTIWENSTFNGPVKFVYLNRTCVRDDNPNDGKCVVGTHQSHASYSGADSYVQAVKNDVFTHYHIITLGTDRPRSDVLKTCEHELQHFRLSNDVGTQNLPMDEQHRLIREKYGGEPNLWDVHGVCWNHLIAGGRG